MRHEFYLQDDQSNKFWTIEVSGTSVITTNGRVGSKPRETRKEHASADQANAAADKEMRAKRKKGYVEGSLAGIPAYDGRLPPRLIRINHDDYHAALIGKTRQGGQFFLTHPFAPAIGDDRGGSFIALYRFDAFGLLADAKILRSLPTRTEDAALEASLLAELGDYRLGDIRVAPFAVEAFGRRFGLIFDPGDEADEEGEVWVTAEPGNYMAFYPPWDGEYDT